MSIFYIFYNLQSGAAKAVGAEFVPADTDTEPRIIVHSPLFYHPTFYLPRTRTLYSSRREVLYCKMHIPEGENVLSS
jgi:hypothetical protein